jgi:hypothetical protein
MRKIRYNNKVGIVVYRYTPEVQELVKSKVKAEPWMHIAFIDNPATTQHNLVYAIYIWDTRKVLGEGIFKFDTRKDGSFGPGRFDGKYNFLKRASDNGKPLIGAKHDFIFDNNNAPMLPLKIKKPITLSRQKPEWTDVLCKGSYPVGCEINGHKVVFHTESARFGFKDGAQFTDSAEVDGKSHKLFSKNAQSTGYYGSPIDFRTTNVDKGFVQFNGKRHVMPNYAKDAVAAFVQVAQHRPEDFTLAFKRAIGCNV